MGIDILNGKFDDDEFDPGFDPDFTGYDDIDVEEDTFEPEITMGDEDDDELIDLGQDVDAWCSRCGTTCSHTVVTRKEGIIKQVLCNGCGDEHSYRPTDDRPVKTTKKQKPVQTVNWATFATKVDQTTVRAYNIKESYQDGDSVTHPSFGLGLVINVKSANKMEVLFESGVKRLIFNR